jgi:hypothetical protein
MTNLFLKRRTFFNWNQNPCKNVDISFMSSLDTCHEVYTVKIYLVKFNKKSMNPVSQNIQSEIKWISVKIYLTLIVFQ